MNVKKITFVALMAALCCILGPLSIPIGAVPISLTVISAYLCAYVLGAKYGTIAFAVYLLLGIVGLPVFSGFAGGLGKIVGPTGGYLVGFIFMIIITGMFIELAGKFSGAAKIAVEAVGMVLGLATCYLFGTIWFMFVANTGFVAALSVCVFPFLIFDAVKIVISLILGNALRAALSRANLIVYKNTSAA